MTWSPAPRIASPFHEPVAVFDLETVPDVDLGRRLWGLTGDDRTVAEKMLIRRKGETGGSDFLKPLFHKIVAIAMTWRHPDGSFKVRALGAAEDDEAALITKFLHAMEKRPLLVSWNGSGFDLPVLHHRAMLNRIPGPTFFDTTSQHAKFDNYWGRYQRRHTDLMDVLANFQARSGAKLDQVAVALGYPGKFGLDGSKVLEKWFGGQRADVRDYCETDVLNTWLVWLDWALAQGILGEDEHATELKSLQAYLEEEGLLRPHLQGFLHAWLHPEEGKSKSTPSTGKRTKVSFPANI